MNIVSRFFQELKRMNIIGICHDMGIVNYSFNDDNSINVFQDLKVHSLSKVRIKYISGNFDCSNSNLTTLYNCPKHIDGNFNASNNLLESLEYGPKYVGGDYNISRNNLTTLKHIQKTINGHFLCDVNKLNSLKYSPSEVKGRIMINGNNLLPYDINTFKYIKLLFKHQEEYGIWYDDGKLNHRRLSIFLKDIKEGYFGSVSFL